jgi:hypothetical protein
MKIAGAYYRWKGHKELQRGDTAHAISAFLRAGDVKGLARVAEHQIARGQSPVAVHALNELGGGRLLIDCAERWLATAQKGLAAKALELSGDLATRLADKQLSRGATGTAIETLHLAGQNERLVALSERLLASGDAALAYRGFELAGRADRIAEFEVHRDKGKCLECGGKGEIEVSLGYATCDPNYDQAYELELCSRCNGTGVVTVTKITYHWTRVESAAGAVAVGRGIGCCRRLSPLMPVPQSRP